MESFTIGLHHAVFDAVVDHFHKMAGPGITAIKIAILRGKGLEDGFEIREGIL